MLVNLGDGDRPFPDARCHALHRPGPYVTGGEYSWQAGFQWKRRVPAGSGPVLAGQVAAGQDEPVPVAQDILG